MDLFVMYEKERKSKVFNYGDVVYYSANNKIKKGYVVGFNQVTRVKCINNPIPFSPYQMLKRVKILTKRDKIKTYLEDAVGKTKKECKKKLKKYRGH